jgi:hypothetical protein
MELSKLHQYAQKVVEEKFDSIGVFYNFNTEANCAERVKSLCVSGLCKRIHNQYSAGGFIESVYNNDLRGTMERGDSEAIMGLKLIYYFTHSCPFNPSHI